VTAPKWADLNDTKISKICKNPQHESQKICVKTGLLSKAANGSGLNGKILPSNLQTTRKTSSNKLQRICNQKSNPKTNKYSFAKRFENLILNKANREHNNKQGSKKIFQSRNCFWRIIQNRIIAIFPSADIFREN
jgi:hypothetical protein